jgi:hypothetical protein
MERMLMPDPGWLSAVKATNPQTWNMYNYVLNNPLINTDPTGKECVWDDGSYDSEHDTDTGSVGQCQGAGGTWVELGQNDNWSGTANSQLGQVVSNIQDGYWNQVGVTGSNGQMNYTFYDGSGRATLTDTGGTLNQYGYSPLEPDSTSPTLLGSYSDPGAAWAKTVFSLSPLKALDPNDQDQRISQLADGVDYQLQHPLGRDLKESTCNLAGITMITAGVLIIPGGTSAAGYTTKAAAAGANMLWGVGTATTLAGTGLMATNVCQ